MDNFQFFSSQAADFFKGEESNSSANKCMLKVAQYAAQLENYDRAIKIYEDVSIAHCHAQYISFCSSWFCASYKTKIRRFRRFLTGSLPILRI